MRKFSGFLSLILCLCLLASCARAPDPSDVNNGESAAPQVALPLTEDDSGGIYTPDAISLEAFASDYVKICADGQGNVWFMDSKRIRLLDKNLEESVFAETSAVLKDIAFLDGLIYALTLENEVLVYDMGGSQTASHKIDVEGAITVTPFKGGEYLYIGVYNNPPISGCLYNMKNGAHTLIDNPDIRYSTAFANGEVYITKHNGGNAVLRPLEDTKKLEDVNVSYFLDVFVYDDISDMYFSASIQQKELYGLEDFGVPPSYLLPLAADDMENYNSFISACAANNRLYVLGKKGSRPVLYVFGLEEAIGQSVSIDTTLLILDMSSTGFIETYKKDFILANPKINIEIMRPGQADENMPDDYEFDDIGYQKLFLEIMGGGINPDIVIYSSHTMRFPAADSGLMCNLSDFPQLEAMFDNPNLMDGVKEICKNKSGQLTGVPVASGIQAFVANTKLFDELGIAVPDIEWDINDYLSLAEDVWQKANGSGSINVLFPVSEPIGFPELYFTAGNNYQPNFNTPEYTEYCRRLFEVQSLYNISFKQFLFDFDYGANMPDNLMLWKMPMNIWFSSILPQDAVILPKPFFLDGYCTDFQFAGIAQNSGNKGIAAKFLEGLFSEEYQRRKASYDNIFYKDISLYESIPNKLPQLEDVYSLVYKNDNGSTCEPNFIGWESQELFPRYKSGELTLDDAVALLQQEAEKRAMG